MVAGFQGQEEREREPGRSRIALYDKPHQSHSILSLVEAVTKVHLHSRGGNIDSTSGWGALVHVTLWACGEGYILVWPSMENIICQRGVSRKYGEWKTLGNALQYYFVSFDLQQMIIIYVRRFGQKEVKHALTENQAVCGWFLKKSLFLECEALSSYCICVPARS